MMLLRETGRRIGTLEFEKRFQLAVDSQTLRGLLRKIDSWVQNDCLPGHACPCGKRNPLPKEIQQLADGVFVSDVLVGDLGRTRGVHNEQRRAGLRANPGIPVIRQGTQIVEQAGAGCQRTGDNFRSPAVDRKQRGEDLVSVSRFEFVPSQGKGLQKRSQPSQFLFGRYGGAIRARFPRRRR